MAMLFILLLITKWLHSFASTGNVANVYTRSGGDAFFICPFHAMAEPLVWRGPINFTIYSINDTINRMVRSRNRINIKGNNSVGEYNLFIWNVTENDLGIYRCETAINGHRMHQEFSLYTAEKPTIIEQPNHVEYEAGLGSIVNISFKVLSYETPSVAWKDTEAGKLGIWEIRKIGEEKYLLTSTLMPYAKSDYRQYGVRVRNSMGSVDLTLKLTNFLVMVTPKYTSCNTSADVQILCSSTTNSSALSTTWKHIRNGVIIREYVDRIIQKNLSILRLRYCDFKDTGQYVCEWEHSGTIYNASTYVRVLGHPILTSKEIRKSHQMTTLKVFFYSETRNVSVTWMYMDMPILKDWQNKVSLIESEVEMDTYSKTVVVSGFMASLWIPSYNKNLRVKQFSCQIYNEYGYIDTSFENSDILAEISEISTVAFNEDTTVKTDGQTQRNISYLVMYVTVGAVVFVLVVASVIYVHTKRHCCKTRGVISIEAPSGESNLQHDVNNELINERQHLYEEVESIHSQVSVISNYESLKSSTSSSNMTSVKEPTNVFVRPTLYGELQRDERNDDGYEMFQDTRNPTVVEMNDLETPSAYFDVLPD